VKKNQARQETKNPILQNPLREKIELIYCTYPQRQKINIANNMSMPEID
jgi:hypothetical protein